MRAVSVIVSSDPASRLTRLGEAEVRELHAVAVLLESLAVRLAPPFDAARRSRGPSRSCSPISLAPAPVDWTARAVS